MPKKPEKPVENPKESAEGNAPCMVPKAGDNPVHDTDWGFILAELLEVPFNSGRAYNEVVEVVEVGGYLK